MTLRRALLAALLALAALPAAARAAPYSDAVRGTAGLAGWWRLGEASGTAIADAKGTTTGTWSGAVILGATGALAGDADTAATLARGAAAALGTFFSPTGDFSLEAWVRPQASTTTRYVLSKGGTTTGFAPVPHPRRAARLPPEHAQRHGDRDGDHGAERRRLAPPRRHARRHRRHLYADGQPVATATAPGAPRTSTSALYAGRLSSGATGWWLGGLDELAVYTGALSAAQVAAHAAAGLDPALPTTTIAGAPTGTVDGSTTTVTLGTASAGPVTYQCSLDRAAWIACRPALT